MMDAKGRRYVELHHNIDFLAERLNEVLESVISKSK